jgi:hypothetical protein
VYALADHPSEVTLRLSMVGPYAVLLGPSGDVSHAQDVAEIVQAAGFQVLGRNVLEIPVTVWSPEAAGSIYEFLFEFDQGLPWHR